MSSNMAVQSYNIGGNLVQPTPEGKIQVKSKTGQIQELTQDQFRNQIKKNEKNLKKGKEIQFDENDFSKAKNYILAKIAGFIVGAGAIVAAVVYRKNIAKWFQKSGEAIKEAVTGKPKNKVKDIFIDKHHLSPETKQIKNKTISQMFSDDGILEAGIKREGQLNKMRADAEAAFKNYDGEAVVKGLKDGKKIEELGLTAHAAAPKDPKFMKLKDIPLTPRAQAMTDAGIRSEAEFAAIKAYAQPNTAVTDKLPKWARDKETCQRYVTSVEARIAKLQKEAAEAAKPVAAAAKPAAAAAPANQQNIADIVAAVQASKKA